MIIEVEYLPGLKSFVHDELSEVLGSAVNHIVSDDADGHILFDYDGKWERLYTLRTVVACYSVLTFNIPRPKALLGHQTFNIILQEIHRIRSDHQSGAFKTFTLSAAGRDSKVLQRFREELEKNTHLVYTPDEADLVLRLRPSEMETGWDVLLRMTPRPLSTRDWRVADMPGALNASIAASIIRLLNPYDAPLLNLMSGSGTFLIENQHQYPQNSCLGVEKDAYALMCTKRNIEASGVQHIGLAQMDATQTGLASHSTDYLVADLPWGQLVGEYDTLDQLYKQTLTEAHRIATPHARFVVLTHAIDKFESVCRDSSWRIVEQYSIFQGGLHPRIYLLVSE